MQILVIGSGRVGSNLAVRLTELGHEVIVIEQDPLLMHNIAELDCIKIVGTPFDQDILKQAGIDTADAVCCVTNSENVNIMTSEVCQRIFNVPLVLTRTYQPGNSESFRQLGLNTVSGTEIIVNRFLHELRASGTAASFELYHSKLRFFEVEPEPDFIGKDIYTCTSFMDVHVFGILRDGKLLLARPHLLIKEGDVLLTTELES